MTLFVEHTLGTFDEQILSPAAVTATAMLVSDHSASSRALPPAFRAPDTRLPPPETCHLPRDQDFSCLSSSLTCSREGTSFPLPCLLSRQTQDNGYKPVGSSHANIKDGDAKAFGEAAGHRRGQGSPLTSEPAACRARRCGPTVRKAKSHSRGTPRMAGLSHRGHSVQTGRREWPL